MKLFLRKIDTNVLKYSSFQTYLRCLTTSLPAKDKLVTVDFNEKTSLAILKLNRPPVNALNMQLLKSLRETISMVENKKCQSLILTSVR